MGRALYISIARKEWTDVQRFLAAYQRYPDRDPMLVHYAEGGLARERGDLFAAEAEYRALLELQADFLPGQLELARALRSEEHTSELQSLMRISYAVFCLKKK